MISTLLVKIFAFYVWLPLVSSVTVSTQYGDIKGLVTSCPSAPGPFKSVSKFLGVPFAAPPIGELRLKAPEPLKEWKPKVLQGTKHGNVCWQREHRVQSIKFFGPNFSYSEDCLYLDIYSPNVSISVPVMVYIPGGDILALHGVVIVVIQYRLGPFGFLTTGDSAAPGNLGMLDQVEALKWVNKNIENFGGDPSKVTIFGTSAGGTSVTLHLLSPLSEGLFHQAIAESGVDLSTFATQPVSYGLRFAKELAQNLDCATSDHSEMVACIRSKKGEETQNASALTDYQFYKGGKFLKKLWCCVGGSITR